eukprot:scaffold179037_cov37-Tisochrysis_lutea.AAC.2
MQRAASAVSSRGTWQDQSCVRARVATDESTDNSASSQHGASGVRRIPCAAQPLPSDRRSCGRLGWPESIG